MNFIYNIFKNITDFCYNRYGKNDLNTLNDDIQYTQDVDNKCNCFEYDTDIDEYLSDNESSNSVNSAIYYGEYDV